MINYYFYVRFLPINMEILKNSRHMSFTGNQWFSDILESQQLGLKFSDQYSSTGITSFYLVNSNFYFFKESHVEPLIQKLISAQCSSLTARPEPLIDSAFICCSSRQPQPSNETALASGLSSAVPPNNWLGNSSHVTSSHLLYILQRQ